MLIRRLEEMLDDVHRFLELLPEFLVFLIAPGVAQADELAVQCRHAVAHLGVELLEVMGKTAQLEWVDDRLGHGLLAGFERERVPDVIFHAERRSSKDKQTRLC